MLKEVKRAMGIGGNMSDGAIARLCRAAAMDMESSGVVLPGTVEFTYAEEPVVDPDTMQTEIDPATGEARYTEVVTDLSTLTDELCVKAISTYVQASFGNPPNYDNLVASYQMLLGKLMVDSKYTDYSMVRPRRPHHDGSGEHVENE